MEFWVSDNGTFNSLLTMFTMPRLNFSMAASTITLRVFHKIFYRLTGLSFLFEEFFGNVLTSLKILLCLFRKINKFNYEIMTEKTQTNLQTYQYNHQKILQIGKTRPANP